MSKSACLLVIGILFDFVLLHVDGSADGSSSSAGSAGGSMAAFSAGSGDSSVLTDPFPLSERKCSLIDLQLEPCVLMDCLMNTGIGLQVRHSDWRTHCTISLFRS